MKNIIFISVMIILTSCSTKSYVGLYGKCEQGYLACNQLILDKNGEFTYYEYWDVGGTHNLVKGKWNVKNDTLYLNSYIQPQDRLDSVIEGKIEQQDSITFEFINCTDNISEYATFTINDENFVYKSNYDGICKMDKKTEINKLSITPLFSREILNFKTLNKSSNYFKIYISEPKINFYFTHEKWLIKNNKVYLHQDSTGHFNKNIFKEKTKMKNKVYYL